jgi:hypothetical protein
MKASSGIKQGSSKNTIVDIFGNGHTILIREKHTLILFSNCCATYTIVSG